MTDDAPELALPTGARAQRRECPFTAGLAPRTNAAGQIVGMVFVRGECGPRCALYDRERDRTCLDRLVTLLETLAPVRPEN